MKNRFAIIEIGSYNTKAHVYENGENIYDNTTTLKLKANYSDNGKISKRDVDDIISIIKKAKEYTSNALYIWV